MILRISPLLAALTACSGSPAPQSRINGTIRGQTFALNDVVSTTGQVSFGSVSRANMGLVSMTSAAGLCAAIGAGHEKRNTEYLSFYLDVTGANGASSPPSGPGTFVVSSELTAPNAMLAAVTFGATDASCASVREQTAVAVSGNVSLTDVGDTAYNGSFDFTLDSNDHITGSFHATSCPAFGAALTQGADLTCVD